MATYGASQLAQGVDLVGVGGVPAPCPASQIFGIPTPPVAYVMRGEDKNTNGLYDTWPSPGSPDYAALLYAGPLTTPLRDVVVQSKG